MYLLTKLKGENILYLWNTNSANKELTFMTTIELEEHWRRYMQFKYVPVFIIAQLY